MLGSHGIRTDLALEATERFTEENVEVRGVEVTEDYNEEKDIRTTIVKITTENGARTMGRPQGNYITIEAPGLSVHDEDYHREISAEIARHLQKLINLEREQSILVVGLGNSAITADSLGPHVVENLNITRHIIRGCRASAESRKGEGCTAPVESFRELWRRQEWRHPETHTGNRGRNETGCSDCNRCAGRLRSTRRLNRTIQITDTGINPGIRSRQSQGRSYRRKSSGESNWYRSSHSSRCSHHCP